MEELNINEMFLGQKLTLMREELQTKDIKKSGENTYAGFKYFELDDILPHIKQLAVKYQIFNKIDFTEDKAILTIINNNKPEEYFVFETNIAKATIKGCNDVQNLGGTQTYLRRYLYFNAYEVSDQDTFDKTQGLKESRENAKIVYNLGGQAGFTLEQIDAQVKKKFGCRIEKLQEDNFKQVIAGYQSLIKKNKPIDSKGVETKEE